MRSSTTRESSSMARVSLATGQLHHRLGIGVGLDDGEVFQPGGQVALHPRHRIAHIVGGRDQVHAGVELDDDAQVALFAGRAHQHHARHPRRRAFQQPGDLGVQRFGRSAREIGAHRHDGPVDVGQLAHLHTQPGRHAGDHDQQVDHDHQPGPADGQARAGRRRGRRSCRYDGMVLQMRLRRWANRPYGQRLNPPPSRVALRACAARLRPPPRPGPSNRPPPAPGRSGAAPRGPATCTALPWRTTHTNEPSRPHCNASSGTLRRRSPGKSRRT